MSYRCDPTGWSGGSCLEELLEESGRDQLTGGGQDGRASAAAFGTPFPQMPRKDTPKMPGAPQTRCCRKGQEQKPDQARAGLPFPPSPSLRSVFKIKTIKMEYFLVYQPLSPPEVPYTHTQSTLEREFSFYFLLKYLFLLLEDSIFPGLPDYWKPWGHQDMGGVEQDEF